MEKNYVLTEEKNGIMENVQLKPENAYKEPKQIKRNKKQEQ